MIVENATLGPLGALRKQLRQVLAACASERCAPEIGKRLEALLDAPDWEHAAEDSNTLRTSLAHWKVFAEHAEGERSRLKHNEAVMMDALYKACGDDEEMVRQTIESQGVLRPDPALLARCPTGKCADPARDCYGSGCLSDEPQSAVAAAYGGLVQTPQG